MQLKAFEHLQVPAHLSGETGENRNYSTGMTSAHSDIEAINMWLNRVKDSPQTFRSYRKEIERLLLWCLVSLNKPFASLNFNDMASYQNFITDPQPCQQWCGGAKHPRTSEHWRPFTGALTLSSQKQAFTILGGAFNFLVSAGYLANNPMALLNKKQYSRVVQSNKAKVERFLEQDLWSHVWQYIHQLPHKSIKQQRQYERIIFLFSLLYLQAPRVSEVASHKMSSFALFKGKWWWHVTGKGNKQARIPVHDDMLTALKRYRCHLELPPLPSSDENTALVCKLNSKSGISADMVYKLVKHTFMGAADALTASSPSQANKLRHASTHWMRHTSITHQADKGIDIRYLQATARHSSIETTKRYLHKEEDVWHDAMSPHKLDKS
jgi:site-specific recombinase XerD